MVLADLGPLRLGHDHAHEIMRLRIGRGDAHCVARVNFRLGEGAFREQQKRQRLGRIEIVGIEPHDAPEQRLRRRRLVLACAKLMQQRQTPDVLGRTLDKLDEFSFGFGGVSRGTSSAGAADFRRRARLRPRRRPVEAAAARVA